jgi:glycerol kinase
MTTGRLTLAIDVGTLSVRAAAYDQNGRQHAFAERAVALNRLSSTHVEQDPLELQSKVWNCINEVLSTPVVRERGVAAAGLASQRSSIVAWDRESGAPLTPVLSWQDRRGSDYLKPLAHHSAAIKDLSGLFLSPHYGASKMRWLLDNVPDLASHAHAARLAMGPLAAYLIASLVEGHPCIVDHVNASRMQLVDLQSRQWSPDLLARFGLSQALLPACQPTQSAYGMLAGTTIPLRAVNGDQNAALYGTGALDEETLIVNVGTGAFAILPTGNQPVHHPRLLTAIANSTVDGATYLLEGTINGAGAALEWVSELLGVDKPSHQLDAWVPAVHAPPVFVNAVGGVGSPMWNSTLEPYFVSEGTVQEKVVAVAESIVFLIRINLEAMTNTGRGVKRIRVTGGLSRSDALCQLLADATQRVVVRPEIKQATSLGIARLAGGLPASSDMDSAETVEDHFLPRPNRGLQNRYRVLCTELGWR